MTRDRLLDLLAGFAGLRLVVVGDYFLDRYWRCDPQLAETSLETGLTAHQVVETTIAAGAAGTVVNNLVALGVGQVAAVGLVGDDGEGYELRRALTDLGVDCAGLLESAAVRTPCYNKAMSTTRNGDSSEFERFDLKNWAAPPDALRQRLQHAVADAARQADGLFVSDQVAEPELGAIDAGLRGWLATWSCAHRDRPVLVDSRRRIQCFDGLSLKPNQAEAAAAWGSQGPAQLVAHLAARQRHPAFVTVGEAGCWVAEVNGAVTHVAGVPAPPPVDIVGAGDAFGAACLASLAVGASAVEAAQCGCLAASVTVRQRGTTGTAQPSQLIELLPSAQWSEPSP